MLENILNFEGVTVLDKKLQRGVNGGQNCKITLMGGPGTTVHDVPGFSEGPSGSNEANDLCVGLIAQDETVDRCFYDCSWDGEG